MTGRPDPARARLRRARLRKQSAHPSPSHTRTVRTPEDPPVATTWNFDGGQEGAGDGLGVEGLGSLVEPTAVSSVVGCAARRHRAQRLREEVSNIDERIDPGGLEPAGDLVGIKAYAPSPADVGDAALVD